MAMLGCDVIVTDQKEVLPLLQRNVDRNISRVMQKNPGLFQTFELSFWTLLWYLIFCDCVVYLNDDSISPKNRLLPELFGSIKVSELQWGDESHIKAVGPPFDYIIGTDVVSVKTNLSSYIVE